MRQKENADPRHRRPEALSCLITGLEPTHADRIAGRNPDIAVVGAGSTRFAGRLTVVPAELPREFLHATPTNTGGNFGDRQVRVLEEATRVSQADFAKSLHRCPARRCCARPIHSALAHPRQARHPGQIPRFVQTQTQLFLNAPPATPRVGWIGFAGRRQFRERRKVEQEVGQQRHAAQRPLGRGLTRIPPHAEQPAREREGARPGPQDAAVIWRRGEARRLEVDRNEAPGRPDHPAFDRLALVVPHDLSAAEPLGPPLRTLLDETGFDDVNEVSGRALGAKGDRFRAHDLIDEQDSANRQGEWVHRDSSSGFPASGKKCDILWLALRTRFEAEALPCLP